MSLVSMFKGKGPSGFGYGSTAGDVTEGLDLTGKTILLTSLLDQLADDGRVVTVSSDAHNGAPKAGIQFDNLDCKRGYSPWANYGQSKLANHLFATALAKRLQGTGKTANSLHPGVIHTNLVRSMNPIARVAMTIGAPLVLKSVPEGAATQTYLAVHPAVAGVSGKYFADCNESKTSAHGYDDAMAEKLWETSEQIVSEVT